MKLFETHAHLDFPNFDKDRDTVIKKCFESGIEYIVNIGIDYQTSLNSIRLSEQYQGIYATVGYHPHEAKFFQKEKLVKLLNNDKVVAFGEIGLDYFKNYSPRDVQLKIFEEQIAIAIEHNLPIVVHNRNSDDDSFAILSDYMPEKVLYHCFSGGMGLLEKILENGWLISISGNITYGDDNLENAARIVPKEQFVVETDSPFLSPVPHRGKRNNPQNLTYIIQKISEIKRIMPKSIAEQSYINAKNFFSKIT